MSAMLTVGWMSSTIVGIAASVCMARAAHLKQSNGITAAVKADVAVAAIIIVV